MSGTVIDRMFQRFATDKMLHFYGIGLFADVAFWAVLAVLFASGVSYSIAMAILLAFGLAWLAAAWKERLDGNTNTAKEHAADISAGLFGALAFIIKNVVVIYTLAFVARGEA